VLLGPKPPDADVWDNMPSGNKLGVMGIDLASGWQAKCWACNSMGRDKKTAQVKKGSVRLWFRLKDGQAEKSMHVQCLENWSFLKCSEAVSPKHISHSLSFLYSHRHNTSFSEELRHAMQHALDELGPLKDKSAESLLTCIKDASSGSGTSAV
jgi:hypothetical protein